MKGESVVLRRAAPVRVRVTDPRGLPVPGVLVAASNRRLAGGLPEWSDAAGRFEVPNGVPEGRRWIEVRRPERVPVLREVDVVAGAGVEVRADL